MGKKTALTKLMEVFRKVIGLNPDYQSALDRIMIVSDQIFAQTPKDMQRLAQTEGYDFPTMKKEGLTIKTDTPQFKRWSKNSPYVSSQNALNYDFQTGKPFVAQSYHGTNAEEDFSVFDISLGGKQTAAKSAELGIFSTNDTKVAAGRMPVAFPPVRKIDANSVRTGVKKVPVVPLSVIPPYWLVSRK
jgi:hypothetical protein